MNQHARKPYEILGLVVVVVVSEEVVCGFVHVDQVFEDGCDGGQEHALTRVTLSDHAEHEFDVDIPGDGSTDCHDNE